ncbi:MAG: hypothetical protein RL086_729 [Bacteroidota bacterium]|jgi:antitoxin component YwqK of YwqJK toxin-antitoxin module
MEEKKYYANETTIHLKEEIVYLCEDMKPLTGCVYEEFESGKQKFEAHYKDGIAHGSFKEWYENGFLKYEYNFEKGVLHGKLEM